MNRMFCLTVGLIIFLLSTANGQEALLAGFRNPPSSAKARTWWHWIDGNVSRQGITADLEAMKRVGIQEAQIFNVGQGFPEGPAKYMGPQWLELVYFAAKEAQRLGLELAFHNSAGWSSSGGPWVSPEDAMQTVVYTQTQIKGGTNLHQQLAKPATRFNYYRDIAVLAFPTPNGDQRIDQLRLKTLSGDQFKVHLLPDDKGIDPESVISKAQVINLSAQVNANGILDWNAPPGEWTIIRFGHTANGTENRPAVSDGKGLEIDKMSRHAMDVHWAAGIKPVLDKLGPLVGPVLNNILIDSYEVGCNNWTKGFAYEFSERRKYNIISYLPTLAGYYVESGEISERFLWDFRKTIGELISENYYAYFGQLCHNVGLKFSVEPYGGPFDSHQVGSKADVVMGEFWLGRTEYSESSKLAASIAHITGSNIVGAESFTSKGGWDTYPGMLKPTGDRMWTNGVNRFIFHTYTHQPWELKPGLTFHMYGLDLNRHNTWWEQSRAYMDYIARSQYLLQKGHGFADVLVFSGEGSPNDAMLRPDITAIGYDYDQIGVNDLVRLKVRNGKLVTPGGLTYSLMILPDCKWSTPQLLQKLKELALAGATIVGPRPAKSPSLTDYPKADIQVQNLANQLWPKNILTTTGLPAIFRKLKLVPDFSAGKPNAGIDYIHRVDGRNDIYFISNSKSVQVTENLSFRVTGKQPSLWDPVTGSSRAVLVWEHRPNGTTRIPITLDANGSAFIVFSGPATRLPHISQIKQNLAYLRPEPLAGLKMIKAEYGTFLPEGMGDVTESIAKAITEKDIRIGAKNDLLPFDPAPGSVKELRVQYTLDGQPQYLSLVEGQSKEIDAAGKKIRIIRALYGKFTQEFKGIPKKYPVYEVTDKVNDFLRSNTLTFMVNDAQFGSSVAGQGEDRELRLTYQVYDEIQQVNVPKGEKVHLEKDRPVPVIGIDYGAPVIWSPYNGRITYNMGKVKPQTIQLKPVPEPIMLTGPWQLSFPHKKNLITELDSWSTSPDDSVRYYSGTAVYKKQFTLAAGMTAKDRSLELDLGSVGVIAEVFLNGKDLGILWKTPFRMDLGTAAHEGKNELEIRVTNLWVNRLIGDARLPDDLIWTDGPPAFWPDWVWDSTLPRTSQRSTFATWRHWGGQSTLKPSGLLGPVVIRIYSKTLLPRFDH